MGSPEHRIENWGRPWPGLLSVAWQTYELVIARIACCHFLDGEFGCEKDISFSFDMISD
jgi:hypothetical protein